MWPFKQRTQLPAINKPKTKPANKIRLFFERYFKASYGDRLQSGWTTATISPDQLVYNNLQVLRARSREQVWNNDYAKRFIGLLKKHVIGQKGVLMQSQVTDDKGKPDVSAQNAIEAHWKKWSRKNHCDVTETLSWVTMQKLAIGTVAQDGEIFIRLHSSGQYGLQLELIDSALIPIRYNEILPDGGFIRFGIEYNRQGKPVAYYLSKISNQHASWQASYEYSMDYERVDEADIIHLFIPEYVGQKRGLPWMSTALYRMRMLEGYEDASLTAARIGASKMGFFTQEGANEYAGDGHDEMGNKVMEVEPGMMETLPAGVDFKAFDPDYPKGEFAGFMKQVLRGIASGLDVSYNTLANDLEGVNFSSMRHGVIEDREIYKSLQAWLIEGLHQPIFEKWVLRAASLGAITVPNRDGNPVALKRSPQSYMNAVFQPRRWDWVDPLKDIKSKSEEIALGITSVSAVIRDRGHDPEEVWREIKAEREVLDDLGIVLPGTQPLQGQTEEEPGNADDES